jgi:recombinational DNA repair protein RecR
VPNLEKNAKIRDRRATLGERLAHMLIRFDKATGVCPVCRTYGKLNMFEFTCPCYNLDRNVASVIVILKDELSLWNVGEKPRMTLQVFRT